MKKKRLVKVLVRLRPCAGDASVRKISPTCLSVEDSSVYASPLTSRFECDAVLSPEDQLSPLIQNWVPSHGNTIVIGYGHTGSGKTFSIFGPGGVLDALSPQLLAVSSASIQVSFIEVYNEGAFDLLVPCTKKLALMEDFSGVTIVKNLTLVQVESLDQLYDIVDLGLANRMVSPNAVHAFSSRSHAILQLKTDQQCVWLVDLAGSERTNPNNTTISSKISSREINNIHKSLHALKRCITALSSSNQHLPARSSVLTRLVFSENVERCVLVACISPDRHLVQETLSTLNFAGLCASSWNSKVHSKSETELLRYALAKLRQELIAEKTRRMQLEREVGLLSSRSSTPSSNNPLVGTIARLALPMKAVPSPDESVVLQVPNDSIKCSPVEKRSPHADLFSILERNPEDSVLSQTWRHNQYDALLQKCWQT